MLKIKSPIFRIAALLLLGFVLFIGCDKSTDNSNDNGNGGTEPNLTLLGTWNLISVIYGGFEITAAGIPLTMTLIVRNDGTFEATVTQDGPTETLTGTYTNTATTVTMNYSDGSTQTSNYHFEGQNLLLEAIIPWDLDDDGIEENIPVTLKYGR